MHVLLLEKSTKIEAKSEKSLNSKRISSSNSMKIEKAEKSIVKICYNLME